MPLFYHQQLQPEGELGVWKLTELESYFVDKIDFEVDEWAEYQQTKGKRRLEWLGVRWLLHQLSGRAVRGAVRKDEFGKPYLVDSDYQISMSHSAKMAAVIATPNPVGVDIQQIVPKIGALAAKFMRPAELESLTDETRLEHLHIYWGAKEVLYKAYGRRALDFRQHIHIEPFVYNVSLGQCQGLIQKDTFEARYQLFYKKIENYILVYGWEEE